MAKGGRTVAELAKLLAAEEKAIAALRKRREALEGKLAALASDIAVLTGGRGIAVATSSKRKKAPNGRRTAGKRKKRGSGKSLRAAVAEIITKAGEPLRAAEIADKLKSVGYKTMSSDPRNMVSALLAQSSDFKRVRKGLYTVKKK